MTPALRLRNSLRMATPIWGGARPCYPFRDYAAHSTQTEQSGETASLSCPLQLFQIYRPHSVQTEQSSETASLISFSRRFHFHFVARPNLVRDLRCSVILIKTHV